MDSSNIILIRTQFMKRFIIFLPILVLAASAQTPEINALTKKREEAIAKIDASYRAELEKLKAKYMAEGNLAAANSAQKRIGSQPLISVAAPKILGRWIVKGEGIRTFSETILQNEHGEKLPWSFKDGLITIDWGKGNWEKLAWYPEAPDILRGTNRYGSPCIYERL